MELEITTGDKVPSPSKVAKETAKKTFTSPEKSKWIVTTTKGAITSIAKPVNTNANVQSLNSSTSTASVTSAVPIHKTAQQIVTSVQTQQTILGTATAVQTLLTRSAEPPVKRKVGRPPKNPKTGPVKPPPKLKLQGLKRPTAPLLKLASSQAKLISSNQKSPITQSKTFHLTPRVISPPPQVTLKHSVHDNMTETSSLSVSSTPMTPTTPVVSQVVNAPNNTKPVPGSVATTTTSSVAKSSNTASCSSITTSVLPTSKPNVPAKKPDSKPKCIDTISNKLLASQQEALAKVTEAALSPSKPNISVNRQITASTKPTMSSQGTSPMSPVAPLSLSPAKAVKSPLATTPNRPVKSTSSSTQTGTPPHSKAKPNTTSVSVATSPIATKSPSSGSVGKESPSKGKDKFTSSGNVKSPSTPTLPPTKLITVKKPNPVSPSRNLFQEILGVKKPKLADSTSQTTKSQLSPGKNKVSMATSPTQSPVKNQEQLKTSPPVVGTKRDANTSTGSMSPTAHRPHIAAAVAPTPPKRPYLPVASSTGSGQVTPPLRLKMSSPGAGDTSPVKSSTREQQQQTRPTQAPEAHSNSKVPEMKDKKPSEGAVVEGRGPEQEVPLDLGTRKSVPVKVT